MTQIIKYCWTIIVTLKPGFFEWIDKFILFAFNELSGAITYAKTEIKNTEKI